MTSQSPQESAARWAIDPVHSSVEFTVKHMMIATVRGRFAKYDVDIDFDADHPERSHVEARVEVASIDTREPQRDAHLRSADFFDVERFPHLTFKSRHIERRGNGSYRVVGDLTIRDVAREVALDATSSGLMKDPWGNQRVGFTAEGSVNRKEFGLNWNVALEAGGWLVGDEVKIAIEAEFVKSNS